MSIFTHQHIFLLFGLHIEHFGCQGIEAQLKKLAFKKENAPKTNVTLCANSASIGKKKKSFK